MCTVYLVPGFQFRSSVHPFYPLQLLQDNIRDKIQIKKSITCQLINKTSPMNLFIVF